MVTKSMLRGSTASAFLLICLIQAAGARQTQYISGISIDGITKQLAVDRTPALYTGNFGDCMGGQSLFNITKFDAAYYKDNSTVLFHLDGTSGIINESLVMRFSMDAYGENRFQKIFDPCSVNIYSLCSLNASVPIEAWAVFPIGPAQVGDIPSLAFNIPDFEGFVRLQIFANSTKSQVGCLQASMTNGVTIGHPRVISPVLALFTAVAIAASFATATYGVSISHMRTHYAHSISAMIVLETFQGIFFSGALSLNFPSVLAAWWSNFAWSAAQIFNRSMIISMNSFNGVTGNASQVGNAGSNVGSRKEGGLAQQIYGRSQPFNASDPYDYTWSGQAEGPGIPLPGTWNGFQSTLAVIGVPAADAFTLALAWLSVLLGISVLSMAFLKLSLELLVRINRMRADRLLYFRSNWVKYTALVNLRVLLMAFTMVMTLSSYQFSIGGRPGPKALAAIFFLLFLLGLGGLAAYGCHLRLRSIRFAVQKDRILILCRTWLRVAPLIYFARSANFKEEKLPVRQIGQIPFIRVQVLYPDDGVDRVTVHEDHGYVTRFGWLSARYRRTRWCFFCCSLMYQLIRAVFIGGGVASPEVQVYGLLGFEIIALLVFAKLRPFEGRRNMALAVWMLGTSKILTTGLSVAFLPTMRPSRILATAIGMVIIAVQGLLVIGLMILVVLGAVSSYMSLTRNNEDFRPKALESTRMHYFEHLQTTAADIRLSKEHTQWENKLQEAEKDIAPIQPSFSVISVRRVSKIEDEDVDEDVDETIFRSLASEPNHPSRPIRLSRSNSVSSRMSTHSLPRAARAHRVSWSSRDLGERDVLSLQRADSRLVKRLSGYGLPPNDSLSVIPPHVVEEEPSLRDLEAASTQPDHRPSTPNTPLDSLPNSTTELQTTDGDSSVGEGFVAWPARTLTHTTR